MRRQLEAEVASLLQGVSPIDWSRLRHFSDEGIADLLTSNGFNLQNRGGLGSPGSPSGSWGELHEQGFGHGGRQ